jgi:hypothetical protein
METAVNFNEAREIIPHEIFQDYLFSMENGEISFTTGCGFISYKPEGKIKVTQTEVVVRIECIKYHLTLWKKIRHAHFMQYSM